MIDSLRLQKFRSYRDESFEFDPGVNIIVGPNASGKTNLLEALLVTLRGSSFRAKDMDLVAFGAPWARLDAIGPDGERVVKLIKQPSGLVKKEFVIHEQKILRLSLQRTIPAVLFEPNYLLLLHGSPEPRRDYLDDLLELTVPGYGKTRRDYRRTLAQRNALLKRGPIAKPQLFAWNIRLSELGAGMVRERARLTHRLDEKLGPLYSELAGSRKVEVKVHYQTGGDVESYASTLLQELERRTDTDIERGFTTVGPHRDDLEVTFNGTPAAIYASRGEARTVLLTLKVIELGLVEDARGQRPLLLLDDVFSELDGQRRRALTQVTRGYQTFLTTTDADVVIQHFMDNCRIIPLGVD